MSSLSSAMAAKQVGENNHFEYNWSVNGFETLFSQLYFQLVRTKDFSRIKDLEYNFNTLLTNAHGNIDNLLLKIFSFIALFTSISGVILFFKKS